MNQELTSFFEKIDFRFGNDKDCLQPKNLIFGEDKFLNGKLNGKTFIYNSPDQANSSFYLIIEALSNEELFKVKRFIWNENKYDLYFLFDGSQSDKLLTLYYAKTNPREPSIKIDSFNGNDEDLTQIEKIRKWKFDSGAFWFEYTEKLNIIKRKKSATVDKKLIEQLKKLKSQLYSELKLLNESPDEIVQALIDRMLFIKFLEDNHIINHSFYKKNFPDLFEKYGEIGFNVLLDLKTVDSINELFKEINILFNNILFLKPNVDTKYLTNNVLESISLAIKQYDWKTKQLSLFDFRFDIIPTQFISHIYEVFLEDNQKNEGIYYTPDKLAQLIIDDTIIKNGTILDPACGSGMFLVLAFNKLLSINPIESKDALEIINHRNKILQDNIFGIEKNNTAWRLSIFSLYLEILKGIHPHDINNFVQKQLNGIFTTPIFNYDLSKNILNCNALEVEKDKLPHKDKKFDFIVGNPPFLEINPDSIEINFIEKYETKIDESIVRAKNVVGYKQISQAFMLKIKSWAKKETRFGFVQNSSNFYNDKSHNFQKFFLTHYQIENFYELSRVKEILFRNAKEDVVVTIFNNKKVNDNKFNYFVVDLEIFSKVFNLLIIREDKKKMFSQKDVLLKNIILRDYLIGNEYDRELVNKLNNNFDILGNFIDENQFDKSAGGMRLTGKELICESLSISKQYYNSLSRKEQKGLIENYKKINISPIQNNEFSIPYYEYNDILPFKAVSNKFIRKIDIIEKKLRRNKDFSYFVDKKLMIRRLPLTINQKHYFSTFLSLNIAAFSDSIFAIKLKNDAPEKLIYSILNSDLINYYLNIVFVKRATGSYPKIEKSNIKKLPIPFPQTMDSKTVENLLELTDSFIYGKVTFAGEMKTLFNQLIFDLYDMSYLERLRITDYFSEEKSVETNILDIYVQTLKSTLELYFTNPPIITYFSNPKTEFSFTIVFISFNEMELKMLNLNKAFNFIINKLIESVDEGFTLLHEMLFGKNCIYIIKDNSHKNWTETKAFEDGRSIINKFIK